MKMRKLLILTSLFALSSCGLFKKKDPIIIDRIVVKWDTIVTERIHVDTSFVTTANDTVFITKEKIRVRVVRRLDTIRVAATYVGDTNAVQTVVLETTRPEKVKRGNSWGEMLMGLAVVLIVVMAFKVFFETIFGNK
jgi:hypothetical protein